MTALPGLCRTAEIIIENWTVERMTPIRSSQLSWRHDGDAWVLLHPRHRMGRVVPDKDHSGMWRSVKVDGILSDTANLCWSKDNVMAQAIREVA